MTSTTHTPVAQAITHALDFDRRNAAYDQGALWAENQRSTYELVSSAAKTLGTDPTFEEWTEYAAQWKDGYVHQNPDNTANAADQQWSRFTKQLGELFGLDKPKSTSAHAEKKAADRSKKTEALLNKYAQQTADEIAAMRRSALEAAAKGSEAAEKIAADLKKVLKAKTSEADKAHTATLKALREQIAAAAKKCTDPEKLEAALDCLDDNAEIEFILE